MKHQFFLLHFAGGSTYSYDFLKKHIKSNIEFIPLELPGRGKRFDQDLLKVKDEAIEDYFNQIISKRNSMPYVIYGHSMGATLSITITAKLESIGDPPEQLIVSGNAGPGITKSDDIIRYQLNDYDFKQELKKLGGVPIEVLENKELFEYFGPIMRADFECLEKYFFSEKGIKLNTPLYALMGNEEETCDRIENWKNFTNADFQFKILKGNHFFIYDHPSELSDIITAYSKTLTIK